MTHDLGLGDLECPFKLPVYPKRKCQKTVTGSYGNELNSELKYILGKTQNSPGNRTVHQFLMFCCIPACRIQVDCFSSLSLHRQSFRKLLP